MSEDDEPVHVPVLGAEVAALVGQALEDDPAGLVADATVGAGGHAELLLDQFSAARLFGIDQDPEILELARRRLLRFGERVRLEHGRISELARRARKCRLPRPRAWLMDLGASSLQLDRPERGFSFRHDGPLDMRMDPTRERTAEAIVNTWDEADLADLFHYEGGEPRARQVARALCESRRRAPIRRTVVLADIVERALGGPTGARLHPATKVFQALRRAVNEEGDELAAGLEAAELLLADGGVLVVLSFHSGEDGQVKRFLAEGARRGAWRVATKKPVRPTREEERANVRARSARLRAAFRVRGFDDLGGRSKDASARTLAERPRAGDGEGGGTP